MEAEVYAWLPAALVAPGLRILETRAAKDSLDDSKEVKTPGEGFSALLV